MIWVRRDSGYRRTALGFTLVELLVVIAIIGVLVALLLPAIQAAREAARRAQCSNNMKNLGLALINYTDVKKRLPAAASAHPGIPFGTRAKGATWVLEILPFIEQQALYDRFDKTISVTMSDRAAPDPNGPLLGIPIPLLVCPSDDASAYGGIGSGVFEAGIKCDAGNAGVFNRIDVPQMGLWYPVSSGPTDFDGCPFCPAPAGQSTNRPSKCCQGMSFGTQPTVAGDPQGVGIRPSFAGLFGRWHIGLRPKEIADGTTNVFMAGEQINGHCRYTCAHCPNFAFSATHIPINTMMRQPDGNFSSGQSGIAGGDPEIGGYGQACGYKSRHPGGAQFVMADGSVHMVNESIDYDLYNRLGERNSGEAKQLQ
jgi:prepilin-type N-terminal cleavage/methylation domain-containing protein/prepilin-type processing-associated H-X9-DG protein